MGGWIGTIGDSFHFSRDQVHNTIMSKPPPGILEPVVMGWAARTNVQVDHGRLVVLARWWDGL